MVPITPLLESKAAIVTGAGSGLGRATAQLLAQRGIGVLVADIASDAGAETVALIRDMGGRASFCLADTTCSDDMRSAVHACVATYGGLNIAVNNAGIEGTLNLAADCEEQDWRRVIDVNLTGVFLSMKHEIVAMLDGGGGAIVNVGSTASIAGVRRMSAYVASKHGLLGLTRAAALDYADQGIRINSVFPGSFRTPMSERLFGHSDIEATLTAITPMGRLGSLAEIAESIAWLCSDAASFVTGAGLSVDGGKRAA